MKDFDFKIGLSFSGGGYRAAAFNLGVLTYLDSISIEEKTLLKSVVALSTVSGGTITGTKYAIGIKRGQQLSEIYASLYRFMSEVELVALGIGRLGDEQGWGEGRIKTLINAFADVYDKELFGGAKFGELLSDVAPIHLKHISFNATEFSNALQFRFQCTERISQPAPGEPSFGIIGNNYFRVPLSAAKEIRMADIMASSSCFPGGFEPINFPSDFCYSDAIHLKELNETAGYPVGLMDGGIVDNQGIEPLLFADSRMKKNRKDPLQVGNVLDLIIISDVASPYMEDYVASEQKAMKGWRTLTPAFIFSVSGFMLITSLFGLIKSIQYQNTAFIIVSTVVATVSLLIFFLGRVFKSLPVKFEVPDFFMKPLGKFLRLKLGVYETLIHNRISSLLKMTNSVFLKHVRRLNYNRIYQDESWINRRVMNAIYELRKGEGPLESKLKNGTLPGYLAPSAQIQQVAGLASSMGTTLWFTNDELKKSNMLNALIACGQFTICWNLLEYIECLSKDKTNTTNSHTVFMEIKGRLMEDWEKYKDDPYWMVNEMNAKWLSLENDNKQTSGN